MSRALFKLPEQDDDIDEGVEGEQVVEASSSKSRKEPAKAAEEGEGEGVVAPAAAETAGTAGAKDKGKKRKTAWDDDEPAEKGAKGEKKSRKDGKQRFILFVGESGRLLQLTILLSLSCESNHYSSLILDYQAISDLRRPKKRCRSISRRRSVSLNYSPIHPFWLVADHRNHRLYAFREAIDDESYPDASCQITRNRIPRITQLDNPPSCVAAASHEPQRAHDKRRAYCRRRRGRR